MSGHRFMRNRVEECMVRWLDLRRAGFQVAMVYPIHISLEDTTVGRDKLYWQDRSNHIRDFPVLRRMAPWLRTVNGRRMRYWDRLAFAAELLALPIGTAAISQACRLSGRQVRHLRGLLFAHGMIASARPHRAYNAGHDNILKGPRVRPEEIEQVRAAADQSLAEVAAQLGISWRRAKYLRTLGKAKP